jgi:hypothetical protein
MIGINTTIVVSVPEIREGVNSFTDNIIACFDENQRLSFSYAHSTITIQLSMAIQKDNTKLKFVNIFKLYHSFHSINIAKPNDRGIVNAAMSHSLNDTSTPMTINTIIIVWIALLLNVL